MSHSASESLPPEMATSTFSSRPNIRCWSIARRVCSRQWRRKQSAQNDAWWRRTSMTGGAPQLLHLVMQAPSCAAGDDRPDLDVVTVLEPRVAGDEAVAADDQHRLTVEPQPPDQVVHAQRPRHLDVALGVVEVHLHASRVGASTWSR